jgi:predicted CopG family antitoxin
MSSKTISLRRETYERLARSKGEGESFSDVIDRLLRAEGEHPLYELVGVLDGEDADGVRERARAFRTDVDDRLGPDA